jgi:hypothetical protein
MSHHPKNQLVRQSPSAPGVSDGDGLPERRGLQASLRHAISQFMAHLGLELTPQLA